MSVSLAAPPLPRRDDREAVRYAAISRRGSAVENRDGSGAALLAQGIAIQLAGVRMSVPQVLGMIGSFTVLSAVGARLTFVLLHNVVPHAGRGGVRRAA